MSTAVYPGSFDPLTNGHVDIVKRALRVFDRLVVAVGYNQAKTTMFTVDERLGLLSEVFEDDPRVEAVCFEGLLMNFVRTRKAQAVIRGLRAVSDFEYEFQMANMNRKLHPGAETFFLMTGADNFYLSSSLVKEVFLLGGCVDTLVPPAVLRELKLKVGDTE